jgi:hypothetical protein
MSVMSNLVLVHLEIVLVSVQDRCIVCGKGTIGSESFWMPSIVLLGDEAQVEARVRSFGDCANLDTRWMHDLGRTYHRLRNDFRCTRWNS